MLTAPASLATRVGIAALALLAAILLLACVRQVAHGLSAGIDEVAHVGAAAWLDATGSNALNLEHPPLTKRLAGLSMRVGGVAPALAAEGPAPDQWDLGRQLLVPDGAIDHARLEAARAPFALLALVGAAGVFGWALALYGRGAAVFALFLYALSPTIHAHGALVLTDLALGAFAVVAMALLWGARRARSLALALAGGVALAAAAMSKFTGLMLVPLALGLAGGFALGMAAIAYACGGPAEYLTGLGMLGHNHRADWRYFALGQFSTDGFVGYFPLTMALKSTPVELGAWALALVAGAMAWPGLRARGAARAALLDLAWLLAFPLAYLLALVLQAPDIGHRYTVPLYPFLFVGAAAVLRLRLAPPLRALAAVLLVAAQGAVALRALPDPLAYFNGLAGCRGARAAFCLDDSNVDWGQSMHRVWPAIAARLGPEEKPVAVLFSALPHDAFLPRFEALRASDWETPRPALYVLSGHHVVRWWAAVPRLPETTLFRALDGAESIGNSYFVLDLRDVAAGPAGQPAAP